MFFISCMSCSFVFVFLRHFLIIRFSVLSAVVDAVMTENPDYEHFGKPVSAAELDSKSKKG